MATVRRAKLADLDELAELAAKTFPLAAPKDAAPESLAAFIAEHLSRDRFVGYLDNATREVFVAGDDRLHGYLMLVDGETGDPDVAEALTIRPTIELSKFYVTMDRHGRGVAGQLMNAAFAAAEARGAAGMWLGVNVENTRAQKFYLGQGFTEVGTKRFQVGERLEHDLVLERRLRYRPKA